MIINKEKIFSIFIGITFFAFGILLIKSNNEHMQSNINQFSNELVKSHAQIIERTVIRNTSSATILGDFIELSNGDMNQFESFAHTLYQQLEGVTNLQLAPNGVVSKIYPIKGHEKAIGHDILKHDKRKKEALLAKRTNHLTIAGPFTLIQGGVAIIARKPVYLGDTFWGFASALIMLEDLISRTELHTLKEQQFIYRLKRIHPDSNKIEIFYGEKHFIGKNIFSQEINIPNGKWFLEIEYQGNIISDNFILFLHLINILIALMLSYLVYLFLGKANELKELNKTLEKEKERFVLAISGANHGIFDWEIGTNNVYFSPRWKSLIGYEDDQISNCISEWDRRVHPDDLKMVKNAIKEYLDGKTEVYDVTFRMKHKKGHWVWIEARGKVSRDDNGNPKRMIGFHIDVTELLEYRQLLEERVKEKTEQLQEAQTMAKIGSWNFNLTTNTLEWSDEIYNIFELERKEFTPSYDAFLNLIHIDDRDYVNEAYENSLKTKQPYGITHRLLLNNGKVKWVREECKTIFNEDGHPVLSVGTVQDITEKHLSEQKYRMLLDLASDGIHILDKDGKVIHCSKSFATTLGYSMEEILNMYVKDFDAIFSKERYEDLFDKRMDTPIIFETKHIKKDGTVLDVQISVKDIKIDDKRYLYASQRDITENKQKDIQLLEQAKMASMGEMIGNIAHQWRQPLNTITVAASGLQLLHTSDLLTEDKVQEFTKTIIDNGKYLSETINTFRNFIKEDNNDERILSLNEEVSYALNIVNTTLKNHHITLKYEENDENIKMLLVVGELPQVVINIINNAKDALKNRNIENPWVKVSVYKKYDTAIITIEDNAQGISDEILPMIFDPYFTTNHKYQGTGLGLYICHKIVTESLHGQLYVQNSENGAKFFIELPIKTNSDKVL